MNETRLLTDRGSFKGQSFPEPNYRELPPWALWRLIEIGWGKHTPDDRRDGRCGWCQKGDADFRGASFKLCIPCAHWLGYLTPWYVARCRRCCRPLNPGAAMGTWVSSSTIDARLCTTCATGYLRFSSDEFCRRLILTGAAGAHLLARLLLERARIRVEVVKAIEASLWANSALFEAVRLQRVSVERLILRVREIAAEIVDDATAPERGTPGAA